MNCLSAVRLTAPFRYSMDVVFCFVFWLVISGWGLSHFWVSRIQVGVYCTLSGFSEGDGRDLTVTFDMCCLSVRLDLERKHCHIVRLLCSLGKTVDFRSYSVQQIICTAGFVFKQNFLQLRFAK